MNCLRCNAEIKGLREGWNKCPKCGFSIFVPKGAKVLKKELFKKNEKDID